jgi:hypothetical protein
MVSSLLPLIFFPIYLIPQKNTIFNAVCRDEFKENPVYLPNFFEIPLENYIINTH